MSGGSHRLPIMEGILPIEKKRIPTEVVAGITLAALAIPEVMGYATIAGMPVVTGLYTLVLPCVVFAFLGSSRHLVVGADSATAAVMAAALAGMAASGSTEYIALAGMLAIMAGALLILARVIKLGFIANFLSRTVLVGFLTGVGIQVAIGQLAGMIGVPTPKGGSLKKLWGTIKDIPDTSVTTLCVSAVGDRDHPRCKKFAPKVPGALIAVVGSMVVSKAADLAAHGVSTLGTVPGGLPNFGFPKGVTLSEVGELVPTAISILVLILAQSAATSRAYAAKYNEPFNENTDLVGLGLASVSAGFSGTFPVNGSPTKTQMVDGAGGRSELAQVATGAITVIVLLFLTKPLQYMPNAVLASVVFLIGVELVDIPGMRKILRLRPDEFVVALVTALTVVLIGVEQGIVLAIVASVISHLRRSYHPNNNMLDGRWPSYTHGPGVADHPLAAGVDRVPVQRVAVLRQRELLPGGSDVPAGEQGSTTRTHVLHRRRRHRRRRLLRSRDDPPDPRHRRRAGCDHPVRRAAAIGDRGVPPPRAGRAVRRIGVLRQHRRCRRGAPGLG